MKQGAVTSVGVFQAGEIREVSPEQGVELVATGVAEAVRVTPETAATLEPETTELPAATPAAAPAPDLGDDDKFEAPAAAIAKTVPRKPPRRGPPVRKGRR